MLMAVSFAALLLTSRSSARPLPDASSAQQAEAAATQAIQSGEFQRARELVQRALQQDPQAIELWNLLGVAQSELQHGEAARKAFEQGLRLAPDSVSLNENLGFLFFREAEYRLSKKYLQKAVDLGSKTPGVHFSLAAAKLRTGERAEALKELKSIQRPLENLGDYWVERGTAELPENSAAAEESFNRALALDHTNLAALNGAASVAEQQGLDEKALALLIQARRSHPDDVPTLLHFGTVCLRRDLGIDGLDAAQKAYKLQPENDYALYLLARANISQQNWQRAYDLFHQFAVRRPTFAPAYYAMGWLDIKLDKSEDAKRQLGRCLELDPDLSDARAELAQLDLENGELEMAQQLFEKVLKQNHRNAKANTGMGDLLLRKGNLDEAQRYLEAAIAAEPKDGSAHYKLSQVLLRKHDVEQANKERTLALALNSEAKRASKAPLRLAMPDSSTLP